MANVIDRLWRKGPKPQTGEVSLDELLGHDVPERVESLAVLESVPNIILTALNLRPEPAEMAKKAAQDEIAANEIAIRALQNRQYALHLNVQNRLPGQ